MTSLIVTPRLEDSFQEQKPTEKYYVENLPERREEIATKREIPSGHEREKSNTRNDEKNVFIFNPRPEKSFNLIVLSALTY